MAREYGEPRDAELTEWMISLERLPLSCPAGLPPHEFYVLRAILEGEVVLPPSSGSDGPCSTCGGQGMVCCGRYLDSGECCAAMDGGASMEPCPGCGGSGSEGRDG